MRLEDWIEEELAQETYLHEMQEQERRYRREMRIYKILQVSAIALLIAFFTFIGVSSCTSEMRYAAARAEGAAQCDREVAAAGGEAAWLDKQLAKGENHD